MPSTARTREDMIALIPAEPSCCIDLGSGWGGMLLLLSDRYPAARIIGYELSWIPYLYSKWACRKRNIEVYRKNYLRVALPEDFVSVCYLCPESMRELAKKPPTSGWLISHTFALPNHKPIQTHVCADVYRTHIYVYDFT